MGIISLQKFSASNGLLRSIIIIISIVIIGLGGGNFYSHAPENFFITIAVLTFIAVVLFIVGTLVDVSFTRGMSFKFLDYSTHMFIGWLLFYASLAKLIVAKRPNSQAMGVAVRVLSGMFGLINSGLLWWLGYLTATDKQGFPCRFSSDVHASDPEMNNQKKPAMFKHTTNGAVWKIDKNVTKRSIEERIQPSIVFDNGKKQARLFTLVIGLVDLILVASTYRMGFFSEEYFLGVVCFNFVVTFSAHVLYMLGISTAYEDELRLLDKSYHIAGGTALVIASSRMLGSTMGMYPVGAHNQEDSAVACIIGIINGLMYAYVGFSRSKAESTTLEAEKLSSKEALNVNHRNEMNRDSINNKMSKAIQPLKPALIFDPTKL